MTNPTIPASSQGVLLEDVDGPTAHAEENPMWHIDPTEWALKVSGRTSHPNIPEGSPDALPDGLCVEIGRRLLLAELEFSDWTLRRVEKLDFVRDRSLTRCLTIDLHVRPDAPVFLDSDGDKQWLVPLSLMRRRTLVNFELRDLSGAQLSRPGRVLTQQLDESILLAAASTVTDDQGDLRKVHEFVKKYVAGTPKDLHNCEKEIENPKYSDLGVFFEDDLFKAILSRFRHGRTQYVFLRKDQGRHRVMKMSFDEPADWTYHKSAFKETDGRWEYQPAPADRCYQPRHILAALGLTPTRIRFHVPAAENAASYQLEITPPRGLGIAKANLLAGRPNDPLARHVMVEGNQQEVALYASGIPRGSLCRAQVDLRIPTRGWLSKTLLSCAVVAGVLMSIYRHLSVFQGGDPQVVADAVRDAVVLLVATSAGVAAMLAERDFRGFTAHLVSKLRVLGATTVGLPIVAASFLIYGTADHSHSQNAMEPGIVTTTGVAFALLTVTAAAWICSWRAERRTGPESGDQTLETDAAPKSQETFDAAMKYCGHDRRAVVIRSAEAWHERYEWTNPLQERAVTTLRRQISFGRAHDWWCTVFDTSCKKESLFHPGRNTWPAPDGPAVNKPQVHFGRSEHCSLTHPSLGGRDGR